ncbi:MAG: tetratricopeptide repeat protein [Syntrophales bacterium]
MGSQGMTMTDLPDRGLTFLVVDDQRDVRKSIRKMLHSLGHATVLEDRDGLEAWQRLLSEPVDVAIVDLFMPGLSGIDLLRRVRKDDRLRTLPFIMVTGVLAEEIVAEAAETDVDAYIIKPFAVQTLEEKINAVLGRRTNPSPLDARLRLAQAFTGEGEYNRALGELKAAMVLQPENPRVYQHLGELYVCRGMLEDAEKAFQKAIHCEPRFTRAYDSLADVFARKGDRERVVVAMRQATAISPKNANRQLNLGKALLESDAVEEAKKAFEQAAREAPADPSIRREIGEALLAGNLNREAEEIFRVLLEENPSDLHLYNRLGIACRRQGRFQDAIDLYGRAIRMDPDDDHLHFNLARVLMEAGRRDESRKHVLRALELYPDFPEAKALLGRLDAGPGGAAPERTSDARDERVNERGKMA